MPKYNEKELESKAKELIAKIKKLDPEAAQYIIDRMAADEELQPSIIRELRKQVADLEKENKGSGGNQDDDDDEKRRKEKAGNGIFDDWDL